VALECKNWSFIVYQRPYPKGERGNDCVGVATPELPADISQTITFPYASATLRRQGPTKRPCLLCEVELMFEVVESHLYQNACLGFQDGGLQAFQTLEVVREWEILHLDPTH
jgi:hypothetical protein